MKLLTEEIIKRLPAIDYTPESSLDDAIIHIAYFLPGTTLHWYALTGDKRPDGDWWCTDGDGGEYGFFSLTELESIVGPYKLRVERDLHFGTDTTMQQQIAELERAIPVKHVSFPISN